MVHIEEYTKEQWSRRYKVKEMTKEYCENITDIRGIDLDEKTETKIIKVVTEILVNKEGKKYAVYYPSVVNVNDGTEVIDYINNESDVKW